MRAGASRRRISDILDQLRIAYIVRVNVYRRQALPYRERPIVNDRRDPTAYRIAIAALGAALAVIFAGIAWVATAHEKVLDYQSTDPPHKKMETGHVLASTYVPAEFWFAAGFLSGVFVGMLIPFSVRPRPPYPSAPECASHQLAWGSILGALVLVAVCAAATTLGFTEDLLPLSALGATVAGVLLGLLIPSPGERDR